jgi:two-component system chemotaxis sensor kinase CheA
MGSRDKDRDKELLKRLLATFRVEAEEHVTAISSGLVELEKASSPERQTEMIESVFREAHSLKGAARAVNLVRIEGICQTLESLFAQLKIQEKVLSPELFDQLHHLVDTLGALLASEGAETETKIVRVEASHPPPRPGTPDVADVTVVAQEIPPAAQYAQSESSSASSFSPSSSNPSSFSPSSSPPGDRPIVRRPENAPEPGHFADPKQGLSETLRVPAAKLDTLLRQAEELIPAKATAAQRVTELREINQVLASWEAESRKIRPHARNLPSSLLGGAEHRLDHTSEHRSEHTSEQCAEYCSELRSEQRAGQRSNPRSSSSNGHATSVSRTVSRTLSGTMKITTFLDRNESALTSVKRKVATLTKHLEYDRRALDRRVDDLVEDMKRVSMLPFAALLESFPKLVRDLSRDCGKDADLTIVGGEIEIDRQILEEMKDPLVHLVRNCIDHGIETPKQREQKGKPPRASIRIEIIPKEADKVTIVVSDDGAGIDVQKVRAASLKLGLVSQEEARVMDEPQTAELIFKSGLSTSPMITEISGRGLGLAIVREKAEKVGGTVSVETQPGSGTTFRLLLPLTLARFRGILVRVGESLFVIPTRPVQRVLRVSRDEIKSAENRETIQIDGRAASAVRLSDVLEIPPTITDADPKAKLPLLVLAWAGEQIGFFVDEILDEREILLKSLGKQLPRVHNVAGATVLGTGKVLPVLNVADLMQSAVKIVPTGAARETEEAPKSILVAEDSITSRTLLKNILEFAGYKVKTAVDGAEAFSVLATEAFDLVVSDVEMPRMSGFDLTAKIRADKRLAQLPVVLVTGLDSRADRERGVDVGANAYIVKSSFDQGNLLEVVRRLI